MSRLSQGHIAEAGREAIWLATRDGFVESGVDTSGRLPDPEPDIPEPGADAATDDADGRRYAYLFHGTPEPTLELQRERPIHRLAACLCAAGMSFTEVARRLNVSRPTVANWFRQQWFQKYVDDEIRQAGLDPLKNLLAGAAKESVLTLVELRDDPKVPASTRARCASDLLDRAYGKAPSVVHHSHGNSAALTEVAAVEREIAELLKTPEFRAAENGGVG